MPLLGIMYLRLTRLTAELAGTQIGSELSLVSNLIIPRPHNAETKKQHKITVHGRLAMPWPRLQNISKIPINYIAPSTTLGISSLADRGKVFS